MRFSVLLPTRNGGQFLATALDSILAQSGDFEVIAGDNANEDGTAAILAERGRDRRLRVVRSDRLLTVTENWMACLQSARGEYHLMIGDDDLLLPHFFDRAEAILREHRDPDCLTFDAFSYIAPGSFAEDAPAMWAPRHFDTRRLRPERELPPEERQAIVQDMFRFKVRFPLNMQLTLFSRDAVDSIPGEFFRAPFPDHFALNSMLLRARRVVITSERMLVVGVSPKSFGHYFYGGQQAGGVQYLGSAVRFEGLVDGSELVNSMHAWLLELQRTYPELASTRVDQWNYAVRQVNYWFRQVEYGRKPLSWLKAQVRQLRPSQALTVLVPVFGYRVIRRVRGRLSGRRATYMSDAWPALRPTSFATVDSFAANLQSE